jgi:hypothetical protein
MLAGYGLNSLYLALRIDSGNAAHCRAGMGSQVFRGTAVNIVKDEHGEAWFKGRDVAKRLEYPNPVKALLMHVESAGQAFTSMNPAYSCRMHTSLLNTTS